MTFQLPPLPYPQNALEPYISAETLGFHHGKHHQAYVETVNELVAGTRFEGMSLGEIIQATATGGELQKLFNNAGQAWNHTFFWHCMRPANAPTDIPDRLARRIDQDLGGLDNFFQEFTAKAKKQFGSGWAWLVLDRGRLKVTTTHDAMTPTVNAQLPLLTVDVWEHAYYLDYQNRRPDFVEAVLRNLVNWSFVAENLEFQGEGSQTAARDYDEATAEFVRSGRVEQSARAARQALESGEAEELRRAEMEGKRHARGEDPALRKGRQQGARSQVEGEGSYTAAREYDERTARFVESGKVGSAAQAARAAVDGPEGEELRRAEAEGKRHAHGEDPALRRGPQRGGRPRSSSRT